MNRDETFSFNNHHHHHHHHHNNEYLEHLTRTGPKRLHVLYKYKLPGADASQFTWELGRYDASTVLLVPTLQALVYDILPWKVPESDARGVDTAFTFGYHWTAASRIRLGSEV